MEKRVDSSLFVNDGSFMERFKQLQQEKEKENENGSTLGGPKASMTVSRTSSHSPVISKTITESKANDKRKPTLAASSGKLAFSLKQKSKLVAPAVKLGEDEDEDDPEAGNISGDGPTKKQKLGQPDASEQSSRQVDVAPPSPSDPAVKKVADKLASFVAKNGRQFEHITRQRNPGDTPFKFLFDEGCADYKYYEYRLIEEEKFLSQAGESQASHNDSHLKTEVGIASGGTNTSAIKFNGGSSRSSQNNSNYQIPASALYESVEDTRASATSAHAASSGGTGYGESSAPSSSDPIAMMEFYMKKAAQEERNRQPKQSKDEMPPPASLQAPAKKGHHMGDYIPPEELEKFLATCNDASAQKVASHAAEKSKIQADNVGHKLLSKMGWKEGEGLGSSRSGISNPISAGNVKKNHLGVGAHEPGEVTSEDDIYEQYKKRMMLGYRYRPNPLNNPRKAYY
ncbi:SURP and G-patch domain-containing protein 1-like protein [Malania oleifera]|uniref:SURP and G-patch domain-containing protein 1-like protein n=1 Tax=Malania oleifera TaxID=397392 RepID=UPI0025ADE4E0|nr:SURP and G-patch domain-containing protein 1-like protein [Malania oleifera]XP_057978706.1 SURP and G-patch domain-containing protein 1-like protein [Malania oleifera]XP_057978707.1 SURP and G-patch domain-containing protein 1-like protein [Malania oleifera]